MMDLAWPCSADKIDIVNWPGLLTIKFHSTFWVSVQGRREGGKVREVREERVRVREYED